jgi:hypothetical protein
MLFKRPETFTAGWSWIGMGSRKLQADGGMTGAILNSHKGFGLDLRPGVSVE